MRTIRVLSAWAALPALLLPRPVAAAGVAIQHDAVSCIVAQQHPRLEACVAPAAEVGRAQIQFRAGGQGLWYAVDLKPEGACHSALLPKPLADTKSIEYFVYAIDRGFDEAKHPERAPDAPHPVRVIAPGKDCEDRKIAAIVSSLASPIVVTAVRTATGAPLSAAALAAAAGQPMAGFSTDGVILSGGGSGGGGETAQSQGGGGGSGFGTFAVLAGLAGAGVWVAKEATKDDEDGDGDPASTDLTGRWSGPMTSSTTSGGATITCTNDLALTVRQTGDTLSGTATAAQGSCTGQGVAASPFSSAGGSGPFTGTARNGQLAFTITIDGACAPGPFTGTYSAGGMNAAFNTTCSLGGRGVVFSGTWAGVRR